MTPLPAHHADYVKMGWVKTTDPSTMRRFAQHHYYKRTRHKHFAIHVPSNNGHYKLFGRPMRGKLCDEFVTEEELFTHLVAQLLIEGDTNA